MSTEIADTPSYKLAIIMPSLRHDKLFSQTLQANADLLTQGFDFQQVVVGPDGVNQGLPAGIAWRKERAGTLGVFDAVAQGFDYAIAELGATHVSYINSDDLLYSGFAHAIELSRQHPDSVVVGRVRWIGADGQDYGLIPHWPWRWLSIDLFEGRKPPFTQQGAIVPVKVWHELGGFDLSYKFIADSVFWHRALRMNRPFEYCCSNVAGYRIRPGQLSGQRVAVEQECGRWHATLDHGKNSRLRRRIGRILMTALNTKIYVRRKWRGLQLRADDAMRLGGF